MKTSSHQRSQALRPYQIVKDMKQVADLLEICFAREGDKDSQRYIANMRRASQNASFLRWASITRQSSMPLQGFVWEIENRIIGNVNLAVFHHKRQRIYLIANVAVHPDYRRQGIARALVFQAMQYAWQHGAQSIWLQVRQENHGAIRLYENLGFITKARRTSWAIAPSYRSHTPPPKVFIAQTSWQDWRKQKTWLETSYPSFLNWFFPVDWHSFSPWRAPLRLLNTMHIKQWRVATNNTLQGVLTWLPAENKRDMLWLAAPVHTDHQALTALLIHAQKNLSTRLELRCDHPASQHTEAFQSAGFKALRTLCWMEAERS